jgi:hypothetical protein
MPVDIEEALLYLCTALKNTTKSHFIMTKEEFEELQLQQSQSGLSLKSYLCQTGTSYSTYNYWRKKYCPGSEPAHHDLAPISIKSTPSLPSFDGQSPQGVALLFPNGLRAHFGSGSERILLDLLTKSLSGHVQSE